MTENDYDPDWKQRKAQSLDRKASAQKRDFANPGDAFLVVTEGTVTEPVYFELLKKKLRLSLIQVEVMPGEHSDPRHVIRTAAKLRDERLELGRRGKLAPDVPESFDHVWAVIDTDVAIREGFWGEVTTLAKQKNVKLAHSSPCFEFWLMLHLLPDRPTNLPDGSAAKKAFKKLLGHDYSTTEAVARKALEPVMKNWPEAVKNAQYARKYHKESGATLPASPSTDVDLLVSALDAAVSTRW